MLSEVYGWLCKELYGLGFSKLGWLLKIQAPGLFPLSPKACCFLVRSPGLVCWMTGLGFCKGGLGFRVLGFGFRV